MSLTPKNWAAFQHYKDRKPPWIKLHHGLLDDYEFSRLPLASRALAPFLWLLASEYEAGEITASQDEIAFRLHVSTKEMRDALSPLIDKGFFVDSNPLATCKQCAMPEIERETQEETEKETEKETDHCAVAEATRTPSGSFEKFWKAYPKRDGSNPKHPAEKLFLAAVKAGAEPEGIIAGAKRYASDPATKVGTEFVAQAVKWLRDKRWLDYPPPPENGAGEHVSGHWIALDTPEWDAWSRHRGRPFALDKRGGWMAPDQWPPGYELKREPECSMANPPFGIGED